MVKLFAIESIGIILCSEGFYQSYLQAIVGKRSAALLAVKKLFFSFEFVIFFWVSRAGQWWRDCRLGCIPL